MHHTPSDKTPVSPPRAWAEINLKHLINNYRTARALEQKRRQAQENSANNQSTLSTMAILKAGAYGHGMERIASTLESLPADEAPAFFGVASVIEARRLTQTGIKTRLFLLGPTSPIERKEVVANQWTPCISSLDEANHFNQLAEKSNLTSPLSVHWAIDTGMGRGGFLPEDLEDLASRWHQFTHLHLEGIGSHLPSADENIAFTCKQFAQFDQIIDTLATLPTPVHFTYYHLANSAGIIEKKYNSQHTNLTRPGLMIYGISPIPNFQSELKPVMSLKSRVSLVRQLPAGHGVSYGSDVILKKDTLVATIGIGYGDGYPHALSNKSPEVFIRETRCPVLGRVTMDQIMVDVTHLEHCQSGDEVELFGEHILVSELASLAKTIPWAILTGITPRVTRVYM